MNSALMTGKYAIRINALIDAHSWNVLLASLVNASMNKPMGIVTLRPISVKSRVGHVQDFSALIYVKDKHVVPIRFAKVEFVS